MTPPTIIIGVRRGNGRPELFKVCHESIMTARAAITATQAALPDAQVILALVPKLGLN